MNDRRHVRRGEDAERERSPGLRSERREHPETASILDLQGSAGNRAVAQLLETRDRHSALAPLQRQPLDQAPGAEPTDSRTQANGTVTIPEMELVMPIISFQQQVKGTNEPKSEAGEVVVSIALASLDPRISEAVAKGTHFETITIAIGSSTTFTLHSVVLSSFNVGSEIATLSLNFTSIEVGSGG